MSRSLKVLLGVLGGAAVLVLVLLPVLAASGLFGSGQMMGQGGMMGGGWGVFGMAWMLLLPLLFIGGPIALAVWAVMMLASRGHASGEHTAGSAGEVHEQSAEETLRQRFARGEIDAEEYEERRRILREESPAAPR